MTADREAIVAEVLDAVGMALGRALVDVFLDGIPDPDREAIVAEILAGLPDLPDPDSEALDAEKLDRLATCAECGGDLDRPHHTSVHPWCRSEDPTGGTAA